MYQIFQACKGSTSLCQDSIAVIQCSDGSLLLCVADGAGGMGGGAEASSFICDLLRQNADELVRKRNFREWLSDIDSQLYRNPLTGESSCIIVCLKYGIVQGASVGDSECWNLEWGKDLTENQYRKPLLGSGMADIVCFRERFDGTLLCGSDGLFKYVDRGKIYKTALKSSRPEIDLLELAKKATGYLQDDFSAIVVRENK